MKKLHASILINAPREKVWEVMLSDATYREWTAAFNPGSYFVGDWSTGSKILFLGPNPDGTPGEGGMVSRIKENRRPEFMSVEHLGLVSNGVEDTESEAAKKWSPAFENYTFNEKDGGTELLIDIDVEEEYYAMFEEMWGKALPLLKTIVER